MRGVSREAAAAGRERLEALLAVPGTDPAAVGDELFAVTGLLDGTAALRRALTDPARDGAAKAALAHQLLSGRISGPTTDLVVGLVRQRWAAAGDLTDALEEMAVQAVLAAAERGGRLDALEDELFRFSRIVAGDVGLRDAVSVRTADQGRKAALVTRLLGGRATPETQRLAVQAVTAPRGLRTEQALEGYVEAAAQRRSQLVAHVVAALPLTEAQRDRLVAGLRRAYGRDIRVNVDVDPSVVGGLRVQVGGEVMDATVQSRLDDARRRLAG